MNTKKYYYVCQRADFVACKANSYVYFKDLRLSPQAIEVYIIIEGF